MGTQVAVKELACLQAKDEAHRRKDQQQDQQQEDDAVVVNDDDAISRLVCGTKCLSFTLVGCLALFMHVMSTAL